MSKYIITNEGLMKWFEAPLTQERMHECSSQLIERIGETNPLEMYVRLKFMADTISEALKSREMQDAVIAEREKYGRFEKVTSNGAEITTAQRTVRDYASCNDKRWNELNAELERIKSEMKEREKLLSGLREPMTVVNEQTGEAFSILPAMQQISDYVKVTFPKA